MNGSPHHRKAVIKLRALGMSRKEIASELGISESTVSYHISRAYRALGIWGQGDSRRFTVLCRMSKLILLVFLFCHQTHAALVQAKQTTGTNAVSLAFNSNNTAGNFIGLGLECNSSTTPAPTITDTNLNSYSLAIGWVQDSGGGNWAAIYYAVNIGAGANTVAVVSCGNVGYSDFIISEFSGVATTTPLRNAGNSATGSGNSLASGSFTSVSGDLILGMAATGTSGAGAGTGFTSLGTDTYSMFEYKLTTNSSENATFIWTGNPVWAAEGVAFKPPSGGGSTVPPMQMTEGVGD